MRLITQEMIEKKASESETWEDGYKGFVNGANWILELLNPKTKPMEERAKDFMHRVAEFNGQYPKEMLRAFYDYWTEHNERGKKMRFEMQKVFDIKKRLVTWSNNEKNRTNGKPTKQNQIDILVTSFAERVQQRANSGAIPEG